jgi:hypothetical protein
MGDKDKRYSKKLDRIERRLDRGMKSKRQAERNLDRAEKITHKANRADAFNNPINKTGPFYKTGCINYNK